MRKSIALVLATAAVVVLVLLGMGHFLNEHQKVISSGDFPGYDHIPYASDYIELADLERGPSETDAEFADRATRHVHLSTYHCDPGTVSLSHVEKAVLWGFEEYGAQPRFDIGVFEPERIVCGFCSERSQALTTILNRNGIPAITFGLHGHVVTKLSIQGGEYFADPDYGTGVFPVGMTRSALLQRYEASTIYDDVGYAVDLIVQHETGEEYFSQPFFEEVSKVRDRFHLLSDIVGACLLLSAGLSTSLLIRTARQSVN